MCIELHLHRTGCDGREPAIVDIAGTLAFNPFRAPPACAHFRSDHDPLDLSPLPEPSEPPEPPQRSPCTSHGPCCVLSGLRFCIAPRPCGHWKKWHKILAPDDDWLGRKADVYALEGLYPESLWEHNGGRVYVLPLDTHETEHNAGHNKESDATVQQSWKVREDYFRQGERLARASARLCDLVKKKRAADEETWRRIPSADVEGAVGHALRMQQKLLRLQVAWERSWLGREVNQPFPSSLVLQHPRGLNMHIQGPRKKLSFTTNSLVAEICGEPFVAPEVNEVLYPRVSIGRAPHVGPEIPETARERIELREQLRHRIRLLRDVARFRTPHNAHSPSHSNACRNLALDKHRHGEAGAPEEERVALQDVVEGMLAVGESGNEYTVAGGRVLVVRQAGSFLGMMAPQHSMVVNVRETIEAARLEYRMKLDAEKKASIAVMTSFSWDDSRSGSISNFEAPKIETSAPEQTRSAGGSEPRRRSRSMFSDSESRTSSLCSNVSSLSSSSSSSGSPASISSLRSCLKQQQPRLHKRVSFFDELIPDQAFEAVSKPVFELDASAVSATMTSATPISPCKPMQARVHESTAVELDADESRLSWSFFRRPDSSVVSDLSSQSSPRPSSSRLSGASFLYPLPQALFSFPRQDSAYTPYRPQSSYIDAETPTQTARCQSMLSSAAEAARSSRRVRRETAYVGGEGRCYSLMAPSDTEPVKEGRWSTRLLWRS